MRPTAASRPRTGASAMSTLASSRDPVDRSRCATGVWRIALRMGYFSRRTEAAEGRSWLRETPHQVDADAWLSRSTSSTRRRGADRAVASETAVVVLPTPPLLLRTAMTTLIVPAFYPQIEPAR